MILLAIAINIDQGVIGMGKTDSTFFICHDDYQRLLSDNLYQK